MTRQYPSAPDGGRAVRGPHGEDPVEEVGVTVAATVGTGGGTPLGVELDRLAAESPDAPAVTCEGVTLSRAGLAVASNRYARTLARLGVAAGDLVTIGLPNGIEFYIVTVAVWKLGATPQPVSARLPAAELEAVIGVADPAVVVGLSSPDGRPSLPPGFEPDPALSGEPLPPVVPPCWKAPTSGGSTGRPKIIMAADAGTSEAVLARAGSLRIEPGCTFLVTAPLYHNAPFTFSLVALASAGHVVVMPRFDPSDVLAHIERYRTTWVYLVPALMGRILRVPAGIRAAADLSSVRTLFHVGAPCPEHVKRGWLEWVPPRVLLEHYTGTEAIAVTAIDGEEWLRHPGSVGRPVSGEILITDEDYRPLPPGEVGEVWMRPPPGRRTYQYVGATPRTWGDWESLGDMGWFDADGYLHLADRRSDMILVGGANVYPAEVEAALEAHPAVESAAVIGLPDDDLGNRVHAIVQTAEPVEEDTLDRFVRERLAPYKVPRTFERSGTPLRDDAGKVRRSALRAARLSPAVP